MDACVYAGRIAPPDEDHVPFREDRWALPAWAVAGWGAEEGTAASAALRHAACHACPCACRLGEHLTRPYRVAAPSLVPLVPGVWHLAKDAQWGKQWVGGRPIDHDFYEDLLARTPPFEGFWHVQVRAGWRRRAGGRRPGGCHSRMRVPRPNSPTLLPELAERQHPQIWDHGAL